jgi:UPF0042 nucleotide-binding protein
MDEIRQTADLIIDTSDHTVHTLRRLIVEKFSRSAEGTPLKVLIVSFGHKYGNPRDLDLLFDVRHLPNPYFEPSLKDFTGAHPKIRAFLDKHSEVGETVDRFVDMLKYLLPFYKREGKSYLTIGVGCTGGRHRSVFVAERIAEALREGGFSPTVLHRNLGSRAADMIEGPHQP